MARVGFANGVMELLVESEQLTHSIEVARLEGASLEAEYASHANPSIIQEAAASQLGMRLDPQVDYLQIQTGE
jgi:cell division protein FtsL